MQASNFAQRSGNFILEANRKFNSASASAFNMTFNRNLVISALVNFLIMIYISRLSPDVPPSVTALFKNQYFRLAVYVLIFLFAKVDASIAIGLAIAFIVTMNLVNNKPAWEFMESVGYLH